MFNFKKKTHVRILDSPNLIIIDPTFIATPMPNGKILILHGNFENITDQAATLKVQNVLQKIAV